MQSNKGISEFKTYINIKDNSTNGEVDFTWEEEKLENFRKLIIREKDLSVRLDNEFLLACLRARKFDYQRTMTLAKNYFAAKRNYPNIFHGFNSIRTKKCFQAQIMGYLPHTDHKGRVLFVVRPAYWHPSEVTLHDIVSTGFLFGDLLLNDEIFQTNGVVIIVDDAGLSLRHAVHITPQLLYQTSIAAFKSTPVRIKEIHFVNLNRIYRPLMSLFLPFLPRKMRNRIHIHSALEGLHEYIPSAYLPCDVGGELPPCDFTACNEEMIENESYFLQNEKYWNSN